MNGTSPNGNGRSISLTSGIQLSAIAAVAVLLGMAKSLVDRDIGRLGEDVKQIRLDLTAHDTKYGHAGVLSDLAAEAARRERGGDGVSQRVDGVREDIARLQAWQEDYARGHIPSSAEPKLAAIEKMFAEVETQFKANKDRVTENEQQMREQSQQNRASIEYNLRVIEEVRERLATVEAWSAPPLVRQPSTPLQPLAPGTATKELAR